MLSFEAFRLTCQGQFPGFASTPPITRVTGDLPHDPGAGVGGAGDGAGVRGAGEEGAGPFLTKQVYIIS